jgi:hypothetical protein
MWEDVPDEAGDIEFPGSDGFILLGMWQWHSYLYPLWHWPLYLYLKELILLCLWIQQWLSLQELPSKNRLMLFRIHLHHIFLPLDK